MPASLLRSSLVIVLVLAALGATACGSGTSTDADHMGGIGAGTMMGQAGSMMGEAADGMMGADAMFAQMMIPHHEQAIEMADMALDPTRGASPAIVDLADRIKAAQGPEIRQMKAWLEANGIPAMMGDEAMMPHAGHGGMEGMLARQQIDELRDARGAAFDRLFAAGMIAHHEGAIAMAREVKANGEDPEFQALADAIIESQQAEIDELRSLVRR